MWRYVIRRLLELIPTLFGLSLAVFLFIHAIPGDPARLVATLAPGFRSGD